MFFELAAGGFLLATLLGGLAIARQIPPAMALAGLVTGVLVFTAVLASSAPTGGFGWANRITLFRAFLVCGIAGALVVPDFLLAHAWAFSGLALVVLVLDGLDGWVARRTGTESEFGARFDMEVDAFLTLVLCAALFVTGLLGPWILLVGLMRYLFVMAGWFLPRLNRPLPERFRRRFLCAFQIAGLAIILTPLVGPGLATGIGLILLAVSGSSFLIDVVWLYRHHEAREFAPSLVGSGAEPAGRHTNEITNQQTFANHGGSNHEPVHSSHRNRRIPGVFRSRKPGPGRPC